MRTLLLRVGLAVIAFFVAAVSGVENCGSPSAFTVDTYGEFNLLNETEPSITCSFLFTSENGRFLHILLGTLDLSAPSSDRLYIYDGNTTAAPLLVTIYAGMTAFSATITTQSHALAIFKADSGPRRKLNPDAIVLIVTERDLRPQTCSGVVTVEVPANGTAGHVSNPVGLEDGVDTGYISGGAPCGWLLQTSSGFIIFIDGGINTNSLAPGDILNFYDGATDNEANRVGTVAGTSESGQGFQFGSTGTSFHIEFVPKNGNAATFSGFSLQYAAIQDQPCSSSALAIDLTNYTYSPYYFTYPINGLQFTIPFASCAWRFIAPPGDTIHFSIAEYPDAATVRLYDGHDTTAPSMSFDRSSTCNEAYLTFEIPYRQQASLSFEVASETYPAPCDEMLVFSNMTGSQIQSFDFPTHAYMTPMMCELQFDSVPGTVIAINFRSIQLGHGDALVLRDGDTLVALPKNFSVALGDDPYFVFLNATYGRLTFNATSRGCGLDPAALGFAFDIMVSDTPVPCAPLVELAYPQNTFCLPESPLQLWYRAGDTNACAFLMTADDPNAIVILFLYVLDMNPRHVIYVYDGNSSEARLIGRAPDSDIDSYHWYSTGPQILLVLNTSGDPSGYSGRGFQAHWQEISKQDFQGCAALTEIHDQTSVIVASNINGYLLSISDSPAPLSLQTCTVIYYRPVGYSALMISVVTGEEIDDRVVVYEGSNTNGTIILICEHNSCNQPVRDSFYVEVVSFSPVITIVFSIGNNVESSPTYYQIDAINSARPSYCAAETTNIVRDGLPLQYTIDVEGGRNCTWIVANADPGQQIDVAVNFPSCGGNLEDPLLDGGEFRLYDGLDASGVLLWTATIYTPLPGQILAYSGSVFVDYRGPVPKDGPAHISTPAVLSFTTVTQSGRLCDGVREITAHEFSNSLGAIWSPNLPYDADNCVMRPNMNCSYRVSSRPGTVVVLEIVYNFLPGSILRVFDGPSTSAPLAALYAGPNEGTQTFALTSNAAFVAFSSDSTPQYDCHCYHFYARERPLDLCPPKEVHLLALVDDHEPYVATTTKYPRNMNCSTDFVVLPTQYIVGIVDVETELGADELIFYENDHVIARFSGQCSSAYFNSECGRVTMRIVTNNVTTAADVSFKCTLYYANHDRYFPENCRAKPPIQATLTDGVCGAIDLATESADRCVTLNSLTSGVMSGTNLTLPNLIVADALEDFQGVILELSFPKLRYVGDFGPTSGTVSIGQLIVPALEYARQFSWYALGISDLRVPNMTTAGAIFIESDVVQRVFLQRVMVVEDVASIVSEAVVEVVLNPAVDVRGKLTIKGPVATLSLPQVTSLRLSLEDSRVEELYLPSLECGWLSVHSGGLMTSVVLPNLREAELLELCIMPSLERVVVPRLEFTNGLTIFRSPVSDIQLPVLYEANMVSFRELSDILTINLPRLELSDHLSLETSARLEKLSTPSLEVGRLNLQSNDFLSVLAACEMRYGSIASAANPSLSCADMNAIGSRLTGALSAPPDCDGATSGVFGCDFDLLVPVPTSSCGFSVACIQVAIDTTFASQNNTIALGPGVYTGCATALNLRGKALRILGAGNNHTVIDCQSTGQALEVSSAEGIDSVFEGITFMRGSATTGGLVIIGGASPTFKECVFASSSAINGGLVAVLNKALPSFINCQFFAGTATEAGGAIYVLGAGVTLNGAKFTSTSAGSQGGALFASLATRPVSLSDVDVSLATSRRGGAIFTDSVITLSDAHFATCSASLFGGALAFVPDAPLGTNVTMTRVSIVNSRAPTGAALYSFSADLDMRGCNFSSNSASSAEGGAVFATCSESYRFLNGIDGPLGVSVYVSDSVFAFNSAATDGGGLYARGVYACVQNTTFDGNSAAGSGAGLAASNAYLAVSDSVFSRQQASLGAGLYCEPFSGTCQVSDSHFLSNAAFTAGGGIYLCAAACPGVNSTTGDDVAFGALPILSSFGNRFSGNVAINGYGPLFATDPLFLEWLVRPDATIVSGKPASSLDSITVKVTDGYGQVVTSSATTLALSLFAVYPNGSSASNAVAVTGSQTVLANQGVAVFPGISIVAASVAATGQNYLLQCQISILDSVSITSPFYLVPCAPGEGKASGTEQVVCVPCAAGSAGSGSGDFTCTPCAAGSFAAESRAITCLPCPVNTSAATAGNSACVACAAGYYAMEPGAIACTQENAITDAGVDIAVPLGASFGILLILALLAAFYVWRLARRRTMKKYYLDEDSTIRTSATETPVQRNVKKMLVATSTTRIGGGLYADVYKAKFENRWVAMKVLKQEAAGNAIALKEFNRETVALSRLVACDHPGIVRLQFFLNKNPMCIGVEFCPNGTVKAALAKEIFSEADRIRITAEAACGLAAIHRMNIAHLDIKTDNLLLDAEFHVKIADFGISRFPGGDTVRMPTEYLDHSLRPTVAAALASGDAAAGTLGGAAGATSLENSTGSVQIQMHSNPVFESVQSNHDSLGPLNRLSLGPLASESSSRPSSTMMMGSTAPSLLQEEENSAFTPQYVDPVRITNDRLNDIEFLKEADVFSFGVVMWAIMGQVEPYLGEEPNALVARLRENPLLRPPPLTSGPQTYAALMQRCWDADRSHRPQMDNVQREMAAIYGVTGGLLLSSYFSPQ